MPDRNSIYSEMFEAYHKSLLNFCISQGIHSKNAEDIVSEAFTRALTKENQFLQLDAKQQKAWLYSAVGNIIKEKNREVTATPFSEIENIENYMEDNDTLKRFKTEEDFRDYVQEIFDELSDEKERELFRLIFEQKIDYQTLCQQFNVSPGATRAMVSRLRKKLRIIVNKLLNH